MAAGLSTLDDPREYLQTLAKGLAVIESFGASAPAMTLSEVARRVGISPGAARRVLHTLQALGYVNMEGSRFLLLPRTLMLGFAYLSSLPLTSLAQPWLTQLTREIDESCSLGVLDGVDVVFIARAAARRLQSDYMTLGMRYPAHSTSAGKLLLALLPDEELRMRLPLLSFRAMTAHTVTTTEALLSALSVIRRQGWAGNDQEAILGLRSIAVPVYADGVVAAALTVSSSVFHTSMDDIVARYLPLLQAAAGSLAETLRARMSPGPV